MFSNGVHFYIQVDVTTLSNEVRSQQIQVFAEKQLDKRDKTKEDKNEESSEIELLARICENQNSLIQEQDSKICVLQNLIADYEQELYDMERKCLIPQQTSCMEEMR